MVLTQNNIVECVPNFSEGRDKAVIHRIMRVIAAQKGVKLLHVDSGYAANRTVMTFAGTPEQVTKAAFKGIEMAARLIDMQQHQGVHPRMGATDVCPFVPLAGTDMQVAIDCARNLGSMVADKLGIPVYLYEHAATAPHRRNLASVRQGEYEGLPQKILQPEWAPDFGKAAFHARSGASIIGARNILLAYNINLNTKDVSIARKIAARLRESGSLSISSGERTPGLLKGVKAIGWYIKEFGVAQISMNIVDRHEAPLHLVFDTCCKLADEYGVRVTGSEVIGLLPQDALVEAGYYFAAKTGRSIEMVDEQEAVHLAIRTLGLSDIKPFDPRQNIIEEALLGDHPVQFGQLTLNRFIEKVNEPLAVPGGGSLAALGVALAAALSNMVVAISDKAGDQLVAASRSLQHSLDYATSLVDKDANAFLKVLHNSDAAANDHLLYAAALVPFQSLQACGQVSKVLREQLDQLRVTLASDVATAAWLLQAAANAAMANIKANGIGDEPGREGLWQQAMQIRTQVIRDIDYIIHQTGFSF
jgi:glutamate formiminotransferase/formiminotetrahydrofolate cyclodeaminase